MGVTTPAAAGRIRRGDAILKLWGDSSSGEVNDWIYVIGERLCHLVFSMPPGTRFTQSDAWKPIYAADELYVVLKGTLVLANPETGELVRADEGEALHFHPNTWHHGFNQGSGELHILDGYGDSKPPLKRLTYRRDEGIGNWPGANGSRKAPTIHKVDPHQTLWRLEGDDHMLVGIWLSTPGLTAGRIELLPGQSSAVRAHNGELVVYVEQGILNVLMPEADPPVRWSELHPEDAFFAPAGTPHRYFNMTDQPVRFLFGVAPDYLPRQGA
jgi:quercetin dioxygenase-like cupin family protein